MIFYACMRFSYFSSSSTCASVFQIDVGGSDNLLLPYADLLH